MRAALVLVFALSAFGCGAKEAPPPQPGINKREIQERADSTHDSLKEEEDRAKKRKDQ